METLFLVYCVFSEKMFKSYYVVWKLVWAFSKKKYHLMFKSYYVVWKLLRGCHNRPRGVGLNRTMQYGNYLSEKPCFQKVSRFKSYYVVWKPIVSFHFFLWGTWFKSYYVVWKLRSMKFLSIRNFMFKSYYVVWKLQNIVFKFLDFFCLNRTMQYGNHL